MVELSLAGGESRGELLVKAVVVFGVVIPLALLAGLYYGSRAAGFEFGNVVFGLTGATTLAWLLFAGWGRRMDAARPTGELLRSSATDYGKEVARGTYARLPLPARALVVLTGTVVLGWVVLLVTL